MNKIICHLVGIDEINKKKLLDLFPKYIDIFDLDYHQQKIYNSQNMIKLKKEWEEINTKIIKEKNKQFISKSYHIKKKMHDVWKNEMINCLEKVNQTTKQYIIIIGFDIFPKDYRIRIKLPLDNIYIKLNSNKIIYDINSQDYSKNQIKYYLNTYNDRIINGKFPLSLLTLSYLMSKHTKFINFYIKKGYNLIQPNKIIHVVNDIVTTINKKLNSYHLISHIAHNPNNSEMPKSNIFIAMVYRSNGIIPVYKNHPIQGFLCKNDALAFAKKKNKKNYLLYLYELNPNQFYIKNGKYYANQTLYPIDEKSILLTENTIK